MKLRNRRINIPQNQIDGRFSRFCQCLNHTDSKQHIKFVVYFNIPTQLSNYLLDQRLITENTSNICSTCCKKNCPNSENKPYTHKEMESVSDSVSVVE